MVIILLPDTAGPTLNLFSIHACIFSYDAEYL